MLKKFFLNVLSSFVGAWVAIVIFVIGIVLLVFGVVNVFISKNTEKLTEHSVLRINLAGSIEETEGEGHFDYIGLLSGKLTKPQTLQTLLAAIREAAVNPKVEAIYLRCDGVSASPATLNALREELVKFRSSGKKIFAYGDYLSMGDYFVATAANEIYLNPAGSLNIQGLNGTSLYMKDLLDKLGIGIQAVRVGSFKSAVEPYTQNEMSEPARKQLKELYGDMWGYITKEISSERNISRVSLDSLVNNFLFLDKASLAENYHLVDDCLYEREVIDIIADYVGKKYNDVNFVSPETVALTVVPREEKKKIAVLYAEGDIAEYEGAGINCHKIVPIIVNLARDPEVKGMVLRVNSPGGSVFGSEQIGEALDYFQSTGKLLAVSMGDYAASGGYWISAGADIIFADPLTVTGSIGIFGIVPNIEKLTDMIGLHPQTVGTNPDVMFPSIFYPMSSKQERALQKNIDRGYSKFITRVATGRHKSLSSVREIAQGRVWNAMTAQKIGLVDSLGGLQDAIDWVAAKEGLDSPQIVSYPQPEPSFLDFLASASITQNKEISAIIERLSQKGLEERTINFAAWFLLQNHIQARSPYFLISFE